MITKCKECGHIVSDKAISCPECGCPINGQTHSDVYTPSIQQPSESVSELEQEQSEQIQSNQIQSNQIQSEQIKNEQPKSEQPKDEQEPYQYKYHYKPNKTKGCWGCFFAVLIVFLLAVVATGAIVFGCVDYVMNYTTTSDFTTVIDDFIDENESEDTYDYTDADVPDEQAETSDEEAEHADETAEIAAEPTATLHGYIGGTTYNITMTIFIDDEGNVSGQYFYDNQGATTATQLLGNYQEPYLTVYEDQSRAGKSAYFEGKYDGETFAGSYTNASGAEYAFMLKAEKNDDTEN